MGAGDKYQFGRTQPLGKVSFGDNSYTDSFVRAPTMDLSATRRNTSPLVMTREAIDQLLNQADGQLKTCQTILDKFNLRMRILQWAEDSARRNQAQAAPADPLAAADSQPAADSRKGLLGRKLLPGRPGAARPDPRPKPSQPRPDATKIAGALSRQEQEIASAIAKIATRDPRVLQQMQIALYQYTEAERSVGAAVVEVARIRQLDPHSAHAELARLEIAKIQGKIYPLTNFSEVFKAYPQISRLFPPPMPRGK